MSWLIGLFGKWKREKELEEEVQSHLEMAARERVERGVDEAEAARAARKEFGNMELVKETTRDVWRRGFFDRLAQDLRFGVRMIAKSPGFAVVAILILALGIGANTALFSVVNGVPLNPLPYPEPEQLVTLHESKPNFDTGSISFPNFRDWRKRITRSLLWHRSSLWVQPHRHGRSRANAREIHFLGLFLRARRQLCAWPDFCSRRG